ncbi:MAG: hypothetical protein QNJ31_08505 [Candidatus Caenarcaniphilales bacterium]|nr:hypothetical protein [Candidatus Caenarcaniphilales bacterium]
MKINKQSSNAFTYKRSQRGSIVAFLLILAAFGLILIFGLIAVELLVKWVTMSRIQTAAQAGAMAYAREIVKIRDNEMGELASAGMGRGAYRINFAQTTRTRQCAAPDYRGCTQVNQNVVNITGNDECSNFLECINASQILLFQLKNGRRPINDASQITDLTKNQCYTPAGETRFMKFNNPPNCSGSIGNIISPITQLDWDFEVGAYGSQAPCTRVSRDNQGINNEKDFCVEAVIRARLDPIIAGGLPFLTGLNFGPRQTLAPVRFITEGDVSIRARAVAMRPTFAVDETNTGTPNRRRRQNGVDFSRVSTDEYYRRGDVLNLSTETVSLENCTSNGGQCAN